VGLDNESGVGTQCFFSSNLVASTIMFRTKRFHHNMCPFKTYPDKFIEVCGALGLIWHHATQLTNCFKVWVATDLNTFMRICLERAHIIKYFG